MKASGNAVLVIKVCCEDFFELKFIPSSNSNYSYYKIVCFVE